MDKLDREHMLGAKPKTAKKNNSCWEKFVRQANAQGFTWDGQRFLNLNLPAKGNNK